jgi:hypothetical protein
LVDEVAVRSIKASGIASLLIAVIPTFLNQTWSLSSILDSRHDLFLVRIISMRNFLPALTLTLLAAVLNPTFSNLPAVKLMLKFSMARLHLSNYMGFNAGIVEVRIDVGGACGTLTGFRNEADAANINVNVVRSCLLVG